LTTTKTADDRGSYYTASLWQIRQYSGYSSGQYSFYVFGDEEWSKTSYHKQADGTLLLHPMIIC